jgi:prepilin-type N-terminal cleavage/methylation domain-containing protein
MKRVQRGFTLIELMLVVAIIGLLASIALPAFRNMSTRSKEAERAMFVEQLKKTLVDDYNADGAFAQRFPPWGSQMWAWPNPALPATPTRRQWDRTIWGWDSTSFAPEGQLYFSYEFNAWDFPAWGSSGMYIYVYSNLEGGPLTRQDIYAWRKVGDQWVEDPNWFGFRNPQTTYW